MEALNEEVANSFPLIDYISLGERNRIELAVSNLLHETRTFVGRTQADQIAYKVHDYAVKSASVARRACKKDPRAINCSLANWLERIPASKYKAYSLEKLEALEQAWTAALGGNGEDSVEILNKLQGQKDTQ